MNLWLPGRELGRDTGEFRVDMDALLHLERVADRDVLCHTGDSAQRSVAAQREGRFEKECMHGCVRLKQLALHLILA